MKNSFLTFLFLIAITSQAQIPENWIGHYSGDLKSTNLVQGQLSEITYHMELIVAPETDSSWHWTIVYGEDSLRQERKYFLRQVSKNAFVIDENNGIVLSTNLFKNQFVSTFEVQGNLIHCVYRFEKKKVIFELTSSANRSATGNTNEDAQMTQDGIPIVYTYKTIASQKAILKKIG